MSLLVASSGCGSPPVSLASGPHSLQPSDYPEVLDRWSRDLSILPVDGIENVLTVRATYLSHEFRWAYVVRAAHDLKLSPTERQELHDREFSVLSKEHEFFVSVMSGVDGSDDLTPEEGPWRIYIEDDKGRRVAPVRVEEVKRPGAEDVKYFAVDSVHRKAYRLHFPPLTEDGHPILQSSTRYFSLAFASPLGQGTLRWDISEQQSESGK